LVWNSTGKLKKIGIGFGIVIGGFFALIIGVAITISSDNVDEVSTQPLTPEMIKHTIPPITTKIIKAPIIEQKTIPPETLTPPPKQSEISTPKQEETPSPSPLEQNEKEEKTDVSQLTVEELEELSISWDYKDILRNIEKYEGKIIHLTGFIWRVEAGGGDRYVLTVWAEPDDNIFYVDYTGSKLLYADTIEVYVTVERIVEVESMLGEAFVNPYPYVKVIQLTCTNC